MGSSFRARWAVPLLALLVTGVPCPAAGAEEPAGEAESPSAGGRLIWSSGDRLNLLGDMWADIPLAGRESQFYLALDARTSIEDTSSGGFDLAFQVQDLDYSMDLGYRAPIPGSSGIRWSVFTGQVGKQRVDSDGQAYLRYAGAGIESADFLGGPRSDRRLRYRLHAAPVYKEREVEADFVLRGDAGWSLGRDPGKRHLRLDLRVNGLVTDGGFDGDWTAGPTFVLPVPGDRRADIFVHYQKSENPLGIGEDAWLTGFQYAEGPGGRRLSIDPPQVDGALAAGGGEGRLSGEFHLHLLSPEIVRRLRVVLDVDANILTADDIGEIYWRYHVGIERPVGDNLGGIWLFHRSNHRLAEPGDSFTSINVLEGGLESPHWALEPRRVAATGAWGRLDWRARAGLLLSSTFGEDRSWHVRGGLRWFLPWSEERLAPYLVADAEQGDVNRETFGVGIVPLDGLAFQIEYRSDEQYLGRDRSALLFTTRRAF